MFKKFVSTILIMALILQCSALTVFADSEIAELLDVDAATVATGTDLPPVETKPEVAPEKTTPDEPKQEEASEPETEVVPEEKLEEAEADQPEEETEEAKTPEKPVVVPEEKTEQSAETPAEKPEENVPSSSDAVIETPVIPEDNTQEKFEESLENVENTENEDLTDGRKGYFTLSEEFVPELQEMVKDNYAEADVLNYNALFGQYNGDISFEEISSKTVKSIVNTFERDLDLSEAEAIIGLYPFGENGEDEPIVKFEVVYSSASNTPLYFENAAGLTVEIGTPKFNEKDGLIHSVVLLNKEALDKLNFYANPGYMADVLKIVSSDAVIHAISISADRYCFANAVAMISDTESAYFIASNQIHFPEGTGYGYSVRYNEDNISFNCLKGSWIDILLDNEALEISAEDAFTFTLPEVPAGKVEATLPKDDEKKNGEKDKNEKDEENKLATDTDLNVKDNDSNESKPATNTDLDISTPATDTDLDVDNTESTVPSAPVEIEAVPDATPIASETIEDLPLNVTETVEVVEEIEEKAEVVVEAQEEESEASAEETVTEDTSETTDYSVIEDLVEEDTTPIEYDSTPVEFDSTEINYNE